MNKILSCFLAVCVFSGCTPSPQQAIVGTWEGKAESGKKIIMRFKESKELDLQLGSNIKKGKYKISGSENPYHLDVTEADGKKSYTIVSIEKNKLLIEHNGYGEARPISLSKSAIVFNRIR